MQKRIFDTLYIRSAQELHFETLITSTFLIGCTWSKSHLIHVLIYFLQFHYHFLWMQATLEDITDFFKKVSKIHKKVKVWVVNPPQIAL